jgi:hypothetical protein
VSHPHGVMHSSIVSPRSAEEYLCLFLLGGSFGASCGGTRVTDRVRWEMQLLMRIAVFSHNKANDDQDKQDSTRRGKDNSDIIRHE